MTQTTSFFREKMSKEKIKNEYDSLLENSRLKKAISYIGKNKKVLDVGCSFGVISYHLAKNKKCKIDAIDINQERLSLARKYMNHPNIKYSKSDVLKLKKKNHYDVIILLEVIEHVENPYEFLSKMYSLLKPNGCLIISTPNANDYLQNIRNLRLFTRSQRKIKAKYVEKRNKVKFGDIDDHLYAWTWETLWRLLNRVGFKYGESDIVSFRSPSYGNFSFFKGELPFFEKVFGPFCTNLVFKVKK